MKTLIKSKSNIHIDSTLPNSITSLNFDKLSKIYFSELWIKHTKWNMSSQMWILKEKYEQNWCKEVIIYWKTDVCKWPSNELSISKPYRCIDIFWIDQAKIMPNTVYIGTTSNRCYENSDEYIKELIVINSNWELRTFWKFKQVNELIVTDVATSKFLVKVPVIDEKNWWYTLSLFNNNWKKICWWFVKINSFETNCNAYPPFYHNHKMWKVVLFHWLSSLDTKDGVCTENLTYKYFLDEWLLIRYSEENWGVDNLRLTLDWWNTFVNFDVADWDRIRIEWKIYLLSILTKYI
jgi:hypothetical protein